MQHSNVNQRNHLWLQRVMAHNSFMMNTLLVCLFINLFFDWYTRSLVISLPAFTALFYSSFLNLIYFSFLSSSPGRLTIKEDTSSFLSFFILFSPSFLLKSIESRPWVIGDAPTMQSQGWPTFHTVKYIEIAFLLKWLFQCSEIHFLTPEMSLTLRSS